MKADARLLTDEQARAAENVAGADKAGLTIRLLLADRSARIAREAADAALLLECLLELDHLESGELNYALGCRLRERLSDPHNLGEPK